MEYTVVRSERRTLALEVTEKGIVVRAPKKVSEREISAFLKRHGRWIEKRLAEAERIKERAADVAVLTPGERAALIAEAKRIIPERAEYYAGIIGVTYGKITLRMQKTKWGSCSPKGDLSFNCLLLLAPPEALDSVVVHELCHRKEMNHSKRFYAEVAKVFPEYGIWKKWLRENGSLLLKRLGGA